MKKNLSLLMSIFMISSSTFASDDKKQTSIYDKILTVMECTRSIHLCSFIHSKIKEIPSIAAPLAVRDRHYTFHEVAASMAARNTEQDLENLNNSEITQPGLCKKIGTSPIWDMQGLEDEMLRAAREQEDAMIEKACEQLNKIKIKNRKTLGYALSDFMLNSLE